MKRLKTIYFFVLIWIVIISGCKGIAVLPAKIVYMYPVGELYEQSAANGAVAKVDNGTLSLYLPMFNNNEQIPRRFEFYWENNKKIWEERRGDATIECILQDRDQSLPSGKTLHLTTNMILVKFPDKPRYGDLAGKMIWLTANVGPDEFKKIRGVYFKSNASYPDLFNQAGDVTDVLR
ncbi:MAG: hypothetical protein WC799_25010 [Desulfobacteraceae bacterium]|jgi:hypothetical protein